MENRPRRFETGIRELDRMLDGLYIGDNVVWHDDAGSLAAVFCLNFIRACQTHGRPLIYVSFDRSPKNLLDKLGALGNNKYLIILDCFTFGKGDGNDVFLKFYRDRSSGYTCRIIRVEKPRNAHHVMEAVYGAHADLAGTVCFVFESLTGMQELWGGEDHIISFYTHSCPRLYELNTVAYWVIEKHAHSQRFKARINQIAQVAIDLSVKRGKTSLTVIKAEKRSLEALNKSVVYWAKDLQLIFESEAGQPGRTDLGSRLREYRTRQGLSQTKLARLVGVTPSTISQVEGSMIYPSLPALYKMAEILSVGVGDFFDTAVKIPRQVVFSADEAATVKFPGLPKKCISGKLLSAANHNSRVEAYQIEINAHKSLSAHFFIHKGEEFGFMLAGELQLEIEQEIHRVRPGDTIHLIKTVPSQWKNPASETARLIWVIVR